MSSYSLFTDKRNARIEAVKVFIGNNKGVEKELLIAKISRTYSISRERVNEYLAVLKLVGEIDYNKKEGVFLIEQKE